eukprot:CAMPEP_0201984080 /NCGR_PEP_ID=MMETSP0904-20121228/82279_1 /ASSEMBLY_ACC=CAM_ASM_000553 /TAXON_ID=420261 /ORGANISM="Thalassiosira antarctica, Strain CCMP982" /LENGTH=92 /DNA_ID=CAMNT_0048537373 /DNA_START=34 /DNA_END=313 /DNA_ORIENTATION=-
MFDRRAHAEEIIAELIGKMWNWFFIGAAGAAIVIAACIAFFVGVNVPNLIYGSAQPSPSGASHKPPICRTKFGAAARIFDAGQASFLRISLW